MKNTVIFVFAISLTVILIGLENHISKAQDGTVKSIKIGNQVWMVENLNVSNFRNGDQIPEAKSDVEWVKAGKERKPVWCYYENKTENGNIYGKLYNWYAVSDSRGFAPQGWHVASDNDWKRLTDILGGDDSAAASMKTITGWIEKGNGTNTSGFAAVPAGSRSKEGEFGYKVAVAYWWTSTVRDKDFAWYRVIDVNPYCIYRTNYWKACGMSVRCLKDY